MKSDRGYTLLETVVTIAITGFLVTALGMVVQLMVTVPESGNDQVDSIHSVQNAAHWVALDGQMAISAIGGNDLTMTLPSGTVISYGLSNTDFERTYESANQTIAQYVSSVNFTVQGRVIYMSIVASPDSRWETSENQTYQVYMRPTG